MLPQLPPSLHAEVTTGAARSSVPGFVNIYRQLTTDILDDDVSTRAKNLEFDSSHVSERLREYHVQAAREAVLVRALRETCLQEVTDRSLSKETRELGYLISAYLTMARNETQDVGDDVEALMAEEFTSFRQNLPELAEALSTHLTHVESTVARMLAPLSPPPPSTEPQPTSSRIPLSRKTTTPTHKPNPARTTPRAATLTTSAQQTQHHASTTILPTLLTTLSSTLHGLLTTQTALLASQIRHAELHTHSRAARHLTSHATFLGAVAEGLSLKSHLLALHREKEAYAGVGVREALRARFDVLRRWEGECDDREKRIGGLLAEYDGGGGGGVGDGVWLTLGRVYAEVEAEIDVVKRDIERLEREVDGGAGRERGVGRYGRID